MGSRGVTVKWSTARRRRPWRTLEGGAVLALPLTAPSLPAAPLPSAAGNPPACRLVRLSDIGWTDATSATAIFSALLRHLGYRPQTPLLWPRHVRVRGAFGSAERREGCPSHDPFPRG